MKIRAVVVDDEPLARGVIKEYLLDYPDIEVIAECGHGREAVGVINAEHPDLVFLDIQMPGLNGFEVLKHITAQPRIIFSTANDSFAIDAFETGAVDYLLKPYNKARFAKAVQRILDRQAQGGLAQEQLEHVIETMRHPKAFLNRLFVRVGDRIIPLPIDSIIWIEASGDYSTLHTLDKNYLCNQGIGALAARLDPSIFVRVHRSAIIAVPAIAHIKSDGEGGYVATMTDTSSVRISRSYAAKVRDLIL